MGSERLEGVVEAEYDAMLWNSTDLDTEQIIPKEKDPSLDSESPEMSDPIGFDAALTIAESFMLTPVLWGTLTKYSDPKFGNESNQTLSSEKSLLEKDEDLLSAKGEFVSTQLDTVITTTERITDIKKYNKKIVDVRTKPSDDVVNNTTASSELETSDKSVFRKRA